MSDTPRHSVSVAAAIFDDSGENVLLIKRRDNGRWEPPGGVLELDETIEDGLRREVREETGAEIEVGPLTGVYKNMQRGIVALVFRCDCLSEPLPRTLTKRRRSMEPVAEHTPYSCRRRTRYASSTRRPSTGNGPSPRRCTDVRGRGAWPSGRAFA